MLLKLWVGFTLGLMVLCVSFAGFWIIVLLQVGLMYLVIGVCGTYVLSVYFVYMWFCI